MIARNCSLAVGQQLLNVGGDVLGAPQISDTQQCFSGNTKRAVEDVGPYNLNF